MMDKARRNGSLCRVVIVFGSREGVPPEVVTSFIDSLGPLDVVMTGGARGVDMVATQRAMERWAKGEIAGVEVFPADFKRLGKPAGPIRNGVMAKRRPDVAVGFRVPYGVESRGTDGMARKLYRLRPVLPVVVVLTDPWDWSEL